MDEQSLFNLCVIIEQILLINPEQITDFINNKPTTCDSYINYIFKESKKLNIKVNNNNAFQKFLSIKNMLYLKTLDI